MICERRRKWPESIWVISTYVIIILIFPSYVKAGESLLQRLQIDSQGDVRYSRYNFTDVKKPYDGIDGWTELKLAYWIDEDKSLSPYLSIIPSYTTESEFWWQRNIQAGIGLQFYPVEILVSRPEGKVKDPYRFLRSIRFFALFAWRDYYDEPEEAEPEDSDFHIGADYYYDNLDSSFDDEIYIAVTWTNAGFRKTNFSFESYDAFLWTGNVKVGPRFKPARTILFPYALADWTYVPKYEERWWENFLRTGAGIRWYPFFPKIVNDIGFFKGILKRFHIYGEALHNIAWLGENPNNNVEETDFRVGLGFSTGGFLKE